MQSGAMLYCSQCGAFTHHASQGRYDHMGALKAVDERCLRCGRIDAGHEVPQDAALSPVELTPLEKARCLFYRYCIARGELTEWPHGPGVWG